MDNKSYSVIILNDRLNNIAKGMQEAVNKFTIVNFSSNVENVDCSIRAVMGGAMTYNYDDNKQSLLIELVRNAFTNVVYYEFNNVPIDTKVFFDYDYVDQDLLLSIYLYVSNTNINKTGIKNGFINLPTWEKLAVNIKKI